MLHVKGALSTMVGANVCDTIECGANFSSVLRMPGYILFVYVYMHVVNNSPAPHQSVFQIQHSRIQVSRGSMVKVRLYDSAGGARSYRMCFVMFTVHVEVCDIMRP